RGDDALPTWSPDGDRLIFNSRRRQFYELYQKPSDGSAAEVRILEQSSNVYPTSWSRDGRFLVYATDSPNSAADLWVLPLTGDRKPIPFVRTPAAENHGSFAPDGRWIAYASNDSGQYEVYVQPFPRTGARFQVSRGGGTQPQWRADGRELFYLSPDATMVSV